MPIGFTVRKITKTCFALAHTAGMGPFSKIVSFYLMFNCTPNILEVFSEEMDDCAPRMQVKDLAEATSHVNKKKGEAAKMCDKSAALDVSLR